MTDEEKIIVLEEKIKHLEDIIKHLEDIIKKLETENELMKSLLRLPTYTYGIR